MSDYTAWGVDWALTSGVAIAWRDPARTICTLRLGVPGGIKGAPRLAAFYTATLSAAAIAAHGGAPTAVYYEQAFGMNIAMHEAAGALQAGLWVALETRTPYAANVWPMLATDCRRALGLPAAIGDTKAEKRRHRKQQQRDYALWLGAEEGLSEDEYDAVCLMHAGELDLDGHGRQTA